MFTIVVGGSEVGFSLTKALVSAGHEVMIIEKDQARFRLIVEEIGPIARCGDGADQTVLDEAGASRADVLIAATGSDATNLVACQVAKNVFNTPRALALVRDSNNRSIFERLGVDVVVNAVHPAVVALEEGIPGQPMVHISDLAPVGTELVSVSVPADSSIVGMSPLEVDLPPHNYICLITKRDETHLPSDTMVVEAGDELFLVVTADDQQEVYDILTGV